MDVQLKELIEKIKNDGVKTAEENAARVLAEARDEAAAIIKKAEDEADNLRKSAKADAEKSERSGREALRQAGRDLLLTVRGDIEGLFGKLLSEKAAEAMDGQVMAEAVKAAVGALAAGGDSDIQLPESSFASLESAMKNALSEAVAAGLEIKPFKGLNAGFRISRKDGSAFYDFSDQEIAAMLGRYLNPKLAALLTD